MPRLVLTKGNARIHVYVAVQLHKDLDANACEPAASMSVGLLVVWNNVLEGRQWSGSENAPVSLSKTVSGALAPLALLAALPRRVRIGLGADFRT